MIPPARTTALVLTVALAAGSAAAQTAPEALLREGVGLRAQGRDVEALARFRAAWEAAPTPRARAQMGWAAQALGRWREAEQALRESLAAADDPWITANRADLARSLRAVGAHLGDLAVSCNVPGARIYLDGELVGTAPLAAPTRAPLGGVTLRVEAEGHLAVTREGVRVRADDIARETIVLTPVPAVRTHLDPAPTPSAPTPSAPTPSAPTPSAPTPSAPTPSAPTPSAPTPSAPPPTVLVVPLPTAPAPTPASAPRSPLAPFGYALLGVGVAGTVTAAVGFALRESAVSRYDDGVRAGTCAGADLPIAQETDPRCLDDRRALEVWGVVRWVGLGVGLAGLGAGVALLLLDGSRDRPRALACGPWADAPGASCAARF